MLGRLHGLDGPAARASGRRRARPRGPRATRPTGEPARTPGGMRQRLGIAGALVHRPPRGDPRRARELARSRGPARRPRPDRRAARRDHRAVLHARPGRRRADLRPGRDPRPRPARGRGAAGGAARALRAARLPDRGRARSGGSARRARRPSCARSTGSPASAVEHGVATVAVSDPARAGREILPAIASSGIGVLSVARARPTLEDVFLRLTGERRRGRPRRDGVRGPARKELAEAWQTRRLPVVAGLFVVIGMISPLTARYLREIMQAALGDQLTIPMPGADGGHGRRAARRRTSPSWERWRRSRWRWAASRASSIAARRRSCSPSP